MWQCFGSATYLEFNGRNIVHSAGIAATGSCQLSLLYTSRGHSTLITPRAAFGASRPSTVYNIACWWLGAQNREWVSWWCWAGTHVRTQEIIEPSTKHISPSSRKTEESTPRRSNRRGRNRNRLEKECSDEYIFFATKQNFTQGWSHHGSRRSTKESTSGRNELTAQIEQTPSRNIPISWRTQKSRWAEPLGCSWRIELHSKL